MDLLSPTLDFVFKKIFGDEKNVDITKSFLSAVLKLPPQELAEITFINTELKRDYLDDKWGILDIRVKTAVGNDINIEVQVGNDQGMAKRSLYYWSKMFASQLNEGDVYTDLPRAIAINVLNFNLFGYAKYHSIFEIREDT